MTASPALLPSQSIVTLHFAGALEAIASKQLLSLSAYFNITLAGEGEIAYHRLKLIR